MPAPRTAGAEPAREDCRATARAPPEGGRYPIERAHRRPFPVALRKAPLRYGRMRASVSAVSRSALAIALTTSARNRARIAGLITRRGPAIPAGVGSQQAA